MKRAILCLCLFASCSPTRQVTIEQEGIKLTYECGRFEPKAKTFEEGRAVMLQALDALPKARESGDLSLFHSMRAARDARDIRRLEELIVTAECKRQP